MKLLVRGLFAFSLALALCLTLSADEKKKEDKKGDKKPAVNPLFTFPKNVNPAPSEEQIKKLAEIEKEYTPRLAECRTKIAAIMTPERQKARAAAIKQAKDDGKKGKEVQEAGYAALKLSDDEKKQLGEHQKASSTLVGEINKKKMALLTDEQKASLKVKKPEPPKDKTPAPAKDKTEPAKDKKTEPKKDAK